MKILIDTEGVTRPVGRFLKQRRVRWAMILAVGAVPAALLAVTKGYTFTDGTVISAAQINDNFDRLYNAVNRLEGTITVSTTCKTLYDSNTSAADGLYFIDPDGSGGLRPFQVYCDMTGGGWTRVDERSQYGFAIHTEGEYVQPYDYELSAAQIAAIKAKASEGKQAWECRTLGVGNVQRVTMNDGTVESFTQCYDPGNTAYITSSGTHTTFARLPFANWRSYDCGDVTEACEFNVAPAYFR